MPGAPGSGPCAVRPVDDHVARSPPSLRSSSWRCLGRHDRPATATRRRGLGHIGLVGAPRTVPIGELHTPRHVLHQLDQLHLRRVFRYGRRYRPDRIVERNDLVGGGRPPPVPGSDGNELDGVACPSATDCVAVGFALVPVPDDETDETVIETWDGSTWSVVPSPDPGYSNSLSSVSCTSTTDCTAAGTSSPESGQPSQTLVESWNGVAWCRSWSHPPDRAVTSPAAYPAEVGRTLRVLPTRPPRRMKLPWPPLTSGTGCGRRSGGVHRDAEPNQRGISWMIRL